VLSPSNSNYFERSTPPVAGAAFQAEGKDEIIKMKFENTLKFARKMDREDPLRSFRNKFHVPRINNKKAIYFTGNSLGLQPTSVKKFVSEELGDWQRFGVEGHLHSRRPWVYYQKFSKKALARLAGAKPLEVVAMNHLTVNLHLLMISFYRPTHERFRIITEAGAFSSDQYAFESQIKLHGLQPDRVLVELRPRRGETYLRTEDIVAAIEENRGELALVIFGGVQYYTGQFFDIKKITQAGHAAGAFVGFDLAHAIGNVPLNLHNDDVDFAVWCGYKYLNSGPGAIAGAYIHERFAKNFSAPRLAGWWGHNEAERFEMKKGFKPIDGVDGWQLSNHPILLGAAHLASLDIFEAAGMKRLRKKSQMLTSFLEFALHDIGGHTEMFQILTPSDPDERGCQLSIFMKKNGRKVFRALSKAGIIADWREPNVIRVAPVPLYNSFEEVFTFGQVFKKAIA
jgi:kynureninase